MVSLVARVLDMVITILCYAIFLRVVLSFFPAIRSNQLVRILNEVTDPLLKPFRGLKFGNAGMGADFSPLAALLVLYLIQGFVLRQLF